MEPETVTSSKVHFRGVQCVLSAWALRTWLDSCFAFHVTMYNILPVLQLSHKSQNSPQ